MDAVKQVKTDMQGVISIKQTMNSSKRDWAHKKIVLVDMHGALVVEQRRMKEQKKTAKIFHKITCSSHQTGVGLTPMGASAAAEMLAAVIARELGAGARRTEKKICDAKKKAV